MPARSLRNIFTKHFFFYLDPCESVCKNGADCQIHGEDVTCECLDGYSGNMCENGLFNKIASFYKILTETLILIYNRMGQLSYRLDQLLRDLSSDSVFIIAGFNSRSR